MRTLFLVFLAVVSGGWAAQADTARKYPPYPEVWGYELPYLREGNRRSQITPFKTESGDINFTYIERKTCSSQDCSDFELYAAGLSFFAGQSRSLSVGEYNEFTQENYNKRIDRTPWLTITFSDGSTIRQDGGCGGSYYCPYPRHLVQRNQQGQIVARKTLLYLLSTPREIKLNPERGYGPNEAVTERVAPMYVYLIPLKDDTFLVYESKGNVILRLDKNLGSRFPLVNKKVFLIDTDIIDRVKDKAKKESSGDIALQYRRVNDLVYESVRTMIKE
ncbi:MAG: hypothetical protein BMS9Abin05_2399 [Rhodothermia bacterium]|nr:MAG: hypothetical protein BMS9Abin05_2399 [Rhodothermia bacterium]